MIRHLVLWPLLALLAFTEAAALANALGGSRPAETVQPAPINDAPLHYCLPNGRTAAGEWCA